MGYAAGFNSQDLSGIRWTTVGEVRIINQTGGEIT